VEHRWIAKASFVSLNLRDNLTVPQADIFYRISPEDSVLTLEKMLELFADAKSSIYFAQFTITHPDIAQVLIKKAKEGIDVKGIMEYEQIGSYSKYPWFELMNMDVKKDKNYCFVFHHKFFIIDEEIVINGSLNPTISGFKRNRENVLIIHSPSVAGIYLKYLNNITRYW
jgi:Phosphatidylserine/phosphatidylglycerophosphate/cardiolipin synthases and related enzymes